MAAEGRLAPQSQVRREADQRWYAAGKIPGLLAAAIPGGDSSAEGSSASRFNAADAEAAPAAAAATVATKSTKTTPQQAELEKAIEQALPAAPRAAAKSNGKAVARKAPTPRAGSAPTSRISEPPAPPPVKPPPLKKPGGPSKPPLPEPAADESPLGIVVAPPIAEPAKGAKSPASGFAAVAEKDAHGLSPLLVGSVLGGVALALLAIGGGVVAWQNLQRTSDKAAIAAKTAAKPAEEQPAISEAELDAILGPIKPPEPAAPGEQAQATASPEQSPETKAKADAAHEEALAEQGLSPADRKVLATKKLIAAQPKWTPVEGVVIRGKFTQVQIAQIWLASDEKGTRVDPALPASALAAAGLPAEATARLSPGKYVFVDVRVSNSGETPRKYNSWNTGGNITAILADGKGEPLPLVPPEDTPSVPRLLSLNIPAGEMFGDILVFEAPQEPFESLKLLLSQAAFAGPERHFALEVPVEFLFKEAEDLPPQTALAADDEAPAEGESRQVRKKTLDPNAPLAPPSIEETTKLLENEKTMRERQNATDVAPTKDDPEKEVKAKSEPKE